ncbi:MAG: HAD family hydrolase, partial [Angelakisella sp.]
MTKKIIISDVDGTLIGNDRKLPPEIDQLAELIKKKNLQFTIASGRIQSRIDGLVEKLGIQLPVIGCNGASAKLGDTYIWNTMIPTFCLKEAILLADSLGMSIVMTDGEKEYAYRKTAWIADLMDNYGRYDGIRQLTEEQWHTEQIQKVLIDDSAKSGRSDEVITLLQQFPQYVSVVKYQSGTLDIMPAGCSKGTAVKRLAEYLGVSLADIVA